MISKMFFKPETSVILPFYNAAPYLGEAIESVLSQTYHNFELLLLDDGSNDGSLEIAQAYKDKRIRIFQSAENRGNATVSNLGLSNAKGKFIARMDADDVSYPNRLETQINFLKARPDIDVLGTAIYTAERGNTFAITYPEAHEDIQAKMLFGLALHNPTVVARQKFLKHYHLTYRESLAEDYDFWSRAIRHGKFANLSEPLLFYRVHPQQISTRLHSEQHKSCVLIRRELLEFFQLQFSDAEYDLFEQIRLEAIQDFDTFQKAIALLNRLENQNKILDLYDANALDTVFKDKIAKCSILNTSTVSQCDNPTSLEFDLKLGSCEK